MSVALTKINSFVENLAEKKIDLSGAGLKIALTNTVHDAAFDELADLTEVAYTYCSARGVTVADSAQSGGTYKLVLTDLVITASGGSIGPFRYIYLYDDSSTGKKLIGYYDYGSELTVTDGNTLTIDFDATNGVLQIA